MKLVYNESLPSRLRRVLTREAKRRNVKLNDVAGEAIAAHYGREWRLSGAEYRPSSARIDKIKVPGELHRLLREEALRVPNGAGTMRGVVLSILSEHFDIKTSVPVTRRPRKERSPQ